MLDMLIKNGTVIDPANNVNSIRNIGIKDGLIADLAKCSDLKAKDIVDASGCFVTPGIIDFHAHLYTDGTERGVYVDPTYFPNGVTTAVDGGSAGVANYPLFYNSIIASSKVRVLSSLNVCSLGLGTVSYNENLDPMAINKNQIRRFIRKYGDNICALKLRQSKEISKEFGLAPLKETRVLADELNVRLIVHATNSPGEIKETLDLLREGDIFCHVFHGKGKTILSENGKVLPEIYEARDRGVLFDAAHGGNQFSNNVARTAIDEGFYPDFISSDISLKTMYRSPLFSMGNVMSKFLNFGINVEELISIVTVTPAKWLGIEKEIGALSPGMCADVAIMRIFDKETSFADSHGNVFEGKTLMRTEMTVREGVTVFRQLGF